MQRQFRFTDLMVNLGPAQEPATIDFTFCPTGSVICALPSQCQQFTCPPLSFCGFCSFQPTCQFCSFQISCPTGTIVTCPTGSIVCPGGSVFQGPGDEVTLPALREQLQQALAQVDAQEEALAEQSKPQTIEEVEEIEERMKNALQELKEIKKDIERKNK